MRTITALYMTISSTSERPFPVFLGRFFWLLRSLQKRFLSTQEFTRFLSTVSSQRQLRALTWSFKQSNLSAWSLLNWHPPHTHLWGRLYFIPVVCSPLSQSHPVTQIMSTEAFLLNRDASVESFSLLMNLKTESATSNEMHPRMIDKNFFYKQYAPQARFLIYKIMRRRQDLSNKMRRSSDFLNKSWLVFCPIDIVCDYFPQITAQNLHLLIYWLIYLKKLIFYFLH